MTSGRSGRSFESGINPAVRRPANWRDADFPYEEQLTAWQKNNFLTRLDLAFSRDQAEKIYVQDRMLENTAKLWAWLEVGAHFYVCGDASPWPRMWTPPYTRSSKPPVARARTRRRLMSPN